MLKVVHCKRDKYDVLIDRTTKWGNPFVIGKDGDRKDVVCKYREWITNGAGKYLLNDLHELYDKTLACWCAPQACHGDVLVDLCNQSRLSPKKDVPLEFFPVKVIIAGSRDILDYKYVSTIVDEIVKKGFDSPQVHLFFKI